MPARLHRLPHYGRLKISGSKSRELLHGQCTGEVRFLGAQQGLFTSLCNLKGRMRASFLTWPDAEGHFYLEMPSALLADIQAYLRKYAPLYRCQVEIDSELTSYVMLGEQEILPKPATTDGLQLYGAAELGWQLPQGDHCCRFWWPASEPLPEALQPLLAEDLDDPYLLGDLGLGHIYLQADQAEQLLPQHIGLDLNGGISFKKGCYTGQEVVARVHYKGKSKQQLLGFTLNPEPLAQLLQQEFPPELGQVLAYNRQGPLHYLYLLGKAPFDSDTFGLTPYAPKLAV